MKVGHHQCPFRVKNRKCREISNPEADLQLIAPPANRELFKSRFAKARKMNGHAPSPRNAVGWSVWLAFLFTWNILCLMWSRSIQRV